MKTSVKKVDASTMELHIAVEGDTVKSKFESVFARIGKEAKVKGFRPGHVPRDILEKEFSGLVHEQVVQELIPELYDQSLDREAIHAVDMPRISDVKIDRSSLSFTATVEVVPEIPLNEYRGIGITYKKVSVTDEELKRNIDSLKESRKADTVDESFAKSLGYPGLPELEASVRRQIAAGKDSSQRHDVERQLVDALLKGLDIKLPQTLVNKQLEELLRQAKVELALRGMDRQQIPAQEEALRKELMPQAQHQVKVYLVMAQIAKAEKIPADQQMTSKVMEYLLKSAKWNVQE